MNMVHSPKNLALEPRGSIAENLWLPVFTGKSNTGEGKGELVIPDNDPESRRSMDPGVRGEDDLPS